MAPTVCNKKEPHVRTGTGIRVSTKLLKNSINSSGSSVSGGECAIIITSDRQAEIRKKIYLRMHSAYEI